MKKVLKIVGIVAAIAAVAAAIYFLVRKIKAKTAPQGGYDEDNYVSCSCLDEDFVSETVAE